MAERQAEYFDGAMDGRTDTVLIHLGMDGSTEFQFDMIMTQTDGEEVHGGDSAATAAASSCSDPVSMRDWISESLDAHAASFDARFEATWGLEATGYGGRYETLK